LKNLTKQEVDMAAEKGKPDAPAKKPGTDNSPGRGGYSHADTRMGHEHSEKLADLEHLITGSDDPPKRKEGEDADALSRSTPPRKK
jgi:hypothetical protein